MNDRCLLRLSERSAAAGAIGYALNQWAALTLYTTQGLLKIDINAAERALRRVAVGSKNRLFAGNDYAGGGTRPTLARRLVTSAGGRSLAAELNGVATSPARPSRNGDGIGGTLTNNLPLVPTL